ncbi:MAG: hypothetical protein A3F40_01565 [Chlamydiae bacterium RIFCSPHIGHO2_12_FULL_27_8]|nr:MAG: hypothetical protein A3F40_01565 [Chlamydiae bacterium RIFCSPHIGHO2_12_FULL_27_8]
MFIDNIKIHFIAGKGGDGTVAWRREKFIPKGGPYGGNGGKGASIILEADENIISLEHFFHKKNIAAQNGNNGEANTRTGRDGEDLILKVPLGTIIKENSIEIFELTKHKETFLLCRGGKGGKGNIHFKSSTNRSPMEFTHGTMGEEKTIELDLKLIANIGLAGFPNAGKSTLMNKLTNNKVKIASYPFTTLYPNIGIIKFEDGSRTFLADIPGIIKDAHLNKGLGLSFLKHIERTQILLFIIDASSEDPLSDFLILRDEINCYNKNILEKPSLIVLNKIDLLLEEDILKIISKFKKFSQKIIKISALENINLDNLMDDLKNLKVSQI